MFLRKGKNIWPSVNYRNMLGISGDFQAACCGAWRVVLPKLSISDRGSTEQVTFSQSTASVGSSTCSRIYKMTLLTDNRSGWSCSRTRNVRRGTEWKSSVANRLKTKEEKSSVEWKHCDVLFCISCAVVENRPHLRRPEFGAALLSELHHLLREFCVMWTFRGKQRQMLARQRKVVKEGDWNRAKFKFEKYIYI